MNNSPLGIRKLIVGIVGLVCLATAAGLFFFTADGLESPAMAVAMRLGIMLGALWLALPSQGESIAWQKTIPIIVTVIVVLAFFARSAKVLAYAIPIAIVVGIVLAFIRPRTNRRPPRR
jgi:hypothetical protein